MTPSDNIQSVAIGMALTWSIEKIKNLAKRFKNRDIAFIEDQDTISIVKDQRKSSEWQIYKQYLENTEFRMLAQMGLALRKLDNKLELQQSLRTKIHDKYGRTGLHRAQLIQNEILNTVIAKIAPQAKPEELAKIIRTLFEQIDIFVLFIQTTDDAENKIEELKIRIHSSLPPVIILYGLKSAKFLVTEITNSLEKSVETNYDVFREESVNKITVCFRRKK